MTNQNTMSYSAYAGLMLYRQQSKSQVEADQTTSSPMSRPMPQPTPSTVVIGKGSIPRRAPGNKKLAAIIQQKIPAYVNATSKIVKTSIVSDIYFAVEDACAREGNSPPFLRWDGSGYRFCNEIAAREKITSSFRDVLHHKYKSSSKQKIAKRRIQNKKGIDKKKTTVTKKQLQIKKFNIIEPDLTQSRPSYCIQETAPLSPDGVQSSSLPQQISCTDSFAKLCTKILGSPTEQYPLTVASLSRLMDFDPRDFDIEPTPIQEISDCSTHSSLSSLEDSSTCSQSQISDLSDEMNFFE